MFVTDVEGVLSDFGTPREKVIQHLSVKDASEFLDQNQTGKGSMEPKVDAAVRFLKHGGKRAVITGLDAITSGVNETAGTQITDAEFNA